LSPDLEGLTAIDVHVHVESDGRGRFSLDGELMAASASYFRATSNRAPGLEEIATHYRERNMAAVVFTVDAGAATGHPPLSSADIADAAAAHSDVLIPFGSVDPARGAAAVRLARRLVEQHGVRGFKLHPSLQAFHPNDRAVYPLYEAFSELGVPVVVHSGQTGIGAGLPGGRGVKLRYSHPLLIDDVAADFPELTIVLAHAGMPWHDSAVSVALHKANVFLDLSGWLPRYLPAPLIRSINSIIRHKVLFGTDFPLLTPDRWLADFDTLEIKPEVRPLILKENAIRMLGLPAPGEESP
jgi:predicted TIM-barrel fold metal-dependent hydrolase